MGIYLHKFDWIDEDADRDGYRDKGLVYNGGWKYMGMDRMCHAVGCNGRWVSCGKAQKYD